MDSETNYVKYTQERSSVLHSGNTSQGFNWQAYIKEHPYLSIGLAVGAGALLVGLLKPRRSTRKRLVNTFTRNMSGATRQLERGVGRVVKKPARAATSFKAAAATLATKAIKTYLKRRLAVALTPYRKRHLFS